MKTLVVKIPEALAAEIEAEARSTGTSKSDVVRRRLQCRDDQAAGKPLTMYDLAHDLIGSVSDNTIPADFGKRKKHYLKKWGYGKRRHR